MYLNFFPPVVLNGFRSKAYRRSSLRLPFTSDCPLLTDSKPLEKINNGIKPLNADLNPIRHLLALLADHIFNVSRLRVNGVIRNPKVISSTFGFCGNYSY